MADKGVGALVVAEDEKWLEFSLNVTIPVNRLDGTASKSTCLGHYDIQGHRQSA